MMCSSAIVSTSAAPFWSTLPSTLKKLGPLPYVMVPRHRFAMSCSWAGVWNRAEQLAAVGDELRSGREARLVGGDEQHQPCDLFRLGDARNREVRYGARADRLSVRAPHHRRAHIAGVDGVDTDVIARELQRCCLGHPAHAPLAGPVCPDPRR